MHPLSPVTPYFDRWTTVFGLCSSKSLSSSIETFKGLILLYDLAWRDIIHVLRQTLTLDLRVQVSVEATTFGDEWLERETRGKR